jgi:fatty acid desaturase
LTLAPLASLWMDSERALALILGFSVLPLAIMTEGLLQLVFVLVDHDHGH